jgi:hypothetical protein
MPFHREPCSNLNPQIIADACFEGRGLGADQRREAIRALILPDFDRS